MPRQLQSRIHSNNNPSEWDLKTSRLDIYNLYDTITPKDDFNNHLFREFNRRASTAGFESLAFAPFDAGFRYSGPNLEGKFASSSAKTSAQASFSGVV